MMIKALLLRLKLIVGVVLVIVLVHILNTLLSGQLNQFGIYPRDFESLHHIVFAPFIHTSTGHLLNNLVALSIFGAICLIRSARFFVTSSVFIIVTSGLLIWLLARDGFHVGASGWIFGLWSVNLAMAWFDRRFTNIVVAFALLFFYGGMIYGILPIDSSVSFEAHLFGAVAGVIYALCYVSLQVRARKRLRE